MLEVLIVYAITKKKWLTKGNAVSWSSHRSVDPLNKPTRMPIYVLSQYQTFQYASSLRFSSSIMY